MDNTMTKKKSFVDKHMDDYAVHGKIDVKTCYNRILNDYMDVDEEEHMHEIVYDALNYLMDQDPTIITTTNED